jgi:uncharacterized protein YneF (UPF0154 family)
MIQLRRSKLIVLSGLIWLVIGALLLKKGLNFLMDDPAMEETALVLVAVALLIGFLKGKFVLEKSAKRGVERLHTLPDPVSLSRIYNARYYILLAIMVGIGLSMNFLGVPNHIRGFIDVAIGAALIKGSMCYFRSLKAV